MKLGCHVSNSGKLMLEGSVLEAISYKAQSFMVYLGPPQSSYRKKASELNSNKMIEILNENNMSINDVIIHAPYIVNLAQGDKDKRQYAIDFITREVLLTYEVGLKTIVLHPGAHMNQGIDVGLSIIIESLKEILEKTKHTNVFIAIETMAGKGTECCYDFCHIKTILDNIQNERLKVCLDTCHIFDAGYDIKNNYEAVMNSFDELIGLNKIAVFHINDSKNECGSKKDRHENIGFGKIGFDALLKVIYDERFLDVPKILETPFYIDGKNIYPPYKYEIEMIKNKKFDEKIIERVREEETWG